MKIEQCKTMIHENDDGDKGIMPVYSTYEAACADIALPHDVLIKAHEVKKIDLLLSFDIPIGYKILIYPRSSTIFNYGIDVVTSVIDSDYKGHCHVVVRSLIDSDIVIEKGVRIAQIELQTTIRVMHWETKDVVRGEGGFGSTGK